MSSELSAEHRVPEPEGGARRGRPPRHEVALRTERLVGIAAALFDRHGYAKVSLEAIASEGQVAVRTIYTTFGSKTGLFERVLQTARDRFLAQVLPIDDGQATPEQELLRFAEQFLTMITSPVAVRMQRMVIAEAGENPGLAGAFYAATASHVRQTLARYFARPAVAAHYRPDLSAAQLADHFVNCIAADHLKSRLYAVSEWPALDAATAARHGVQLFQRATGNFIPT